MNITLFNKYYLTLPAPSSTNPELIILLFSVNLLVVKKFILILFTDTSKMEEMAAILLATAPLSYSTHLE